MRDNGPKTKARALLAKLTQWQVVKDGERTRVVLRGDFTEASSALARAQSLASSSGERLVEARIAFTLGELALAGGKPPQAVVHLHRALGLFRGIQAPVFEARVLAMLTEAYTAASGSDQASTDPASGPGAALQR